jgi:hypothetical protein
VTLSTEQQIQANRENARRSTGPKDTSHTRLNATKGGLFSSATLLTSGPLKEDPQELADLRDQLLQVLRPANMVEELVADDFVRAAWQLRRYCHYESKMIRLAAAGYLAPEPSPTQGTLTERLNELKQVQGEIAAVGLPDPIAANPALARRLYLYLQPYLPKDAPSPEAENADQEWATYGRKILTWVCTQWAAQPHEIWDQVANQLQSLEASLRETIRNNRRHLLVQETLALGLELPYHVSHRGEQLRREFYAVLREYRSLKAQGRAISPMEAPAFGADFEKPSR